MEVQCFTHKVPSLSTMSSRSTMSLFVLCWCMDVQTFKCLARETDRQTDRLCVVLHSFRVFVCGHSAGAHLAACLLYTDWSKYGLPPSPAPLAGAVLLSGMYDLAPIRQSCVNDSLKLTEYVLTLEPNPLTAFQILLLICLIREEVLEWSPQKNLELIRERLPSQFPCMMAMGKYESDEYHRQGEEFHKVCDL